MTNETKTPSADDFEADFLKAANRLVVKYRAQAAENDHLHNTHRVEIDRLGVELVMIRSVINGPKHSAELEQSK